MKKVLAELHELINNLEDHGLIAEASTLQEVFVRVAQEADTKDDLKNDVENILKSHSAPEVIAELAKQMAGGDDTKTMSFAYGKEPADAIIDNFVDQAKRNELYDPSILKMMNDRLVFNGHPTLTKEEFLAKVNSSDTNVSEFAYGDEPELTKMVPYPEQTPEHREKVLKDFKKQMDEMNKYYDKNYPWTTAPMPYSPLSSENFYEKKK